METIYISIFVPLLNETFELKVSNYIKIETLLNLINSGLENISHNQYLRSDNSVLYSKAKDLILPYQNRLFECDVQNGATLYLF